MKKFLTALAVVLLAISATANDSMYYTLGSQLVPIQATDIRLDKEVLTITLQNDGYALVDVRYELFNSGAERNVTMGFEADAPYMGLDFDASGVHPYIKDFSVETNGTRLPYRNALVLLGAIDRHQDLVTLNPAEWKEPSGDQDYFEGVLYNQRLDSLAQYAYAYYFEAHFKPGINTIHHTYRYHVGISVGQAFFLDYKLTPATRWQGGKIGDFTCIVRADNTFKNFCIDDLAFDTFNGAPIWTIYGTGKQRQREYSNDSYVIVDEDTGDTITEPITEFATEFVLRNAEARFHATNFAPDAELHIQSADNYMFRSSDDVPPTDFYYDAGMPYASNFYDRDRTPVVNGKEIPAERILRNLPFAARGLVFKDKQLRKYFEGLWWYMPDPSYKADFSKLLPREQEWISSIDNPVKD